LFKHGIYAISFQVQQIKLEENLFQSKIIGSLQRKKINPIIDPLCENAGFQDATWKPAQKFKIVFASP